MTRVALTIALALLFAQPVFAQWTLVRSWDMEDGKVPNVDRNNANCSGSITVASSPAPRAGTSSLKMSTFAAACDPHGPRAQLIFEGPDDGTWNIPWNDQTRERRYVFSSLSPQVVPSWDKRMMIAQWWLPHTTVPAIMLFHFDQTASGDRYQLTRAGNDQAILTPWTTIGHSSSSGFWFAEDYFPMDVNKWQDFDIRIKWSKTTDGYIEVWRNGRLEYSRKGITVIDVNRDWKQVPNFSLQSYGRQTYTVFFDDIKIYDKTLALPPQSVTAPNTPTQLMFATTLPPPTGDYSLVTREQTVAPGGVISLDWTAPAGSRADDWIGFYFAHGSHNSTLKYINTNGSSSGTWVVTAPQQKGATVEFRYFTGARTGGKWTLKARSASVEIK